MKWMKTIRAILAGLMLIGNPAIWLETVLSTQARIALAAFVGSMFFTAKTACARNFPANTTSVTDLRKTNLSDYPTDDELSKLRIFSQPFIPTSAAPVSDENHDLALAIKRTLSNPADESMQALEDFVIRHPDSRWVLSVEFNRGLVLYQHGYFSKCVDAYQKAWDAGKREMRGPAWDLANKAVAELMQMDCRVGRVEETKTLLSSVQDRHPDSDTARKFVMTGQAIWHMENVPGRSFLCGPFALKHILESQKAPNANDAIFDTIQSPKTGFSLTELQKLSDKLGMDMQMAKRKPGAQVITPSIVNWKLGHYAALVGEDKGRIHSVDPTFRNETWLTEKTLDEESSGYFLVPAGELPEGWQAVSDEEGSSVFGKGFKGFGGPIPPCTDCCPTCSTCTYMPKADIDTTSAALMIRDTPLFYKPPVGPKINFSLHYHQYYGNPLPGSNFGTNWAFNWQASINYQYFVTESIINGIEVFSATAYGFNCTVPDGGNEAFTPGLNSVYTNAFYQTTGDFGFDYGLPTVITRTLKDGSVETYGQAVGGPGSVTLFLTAITDPQGNTMQISYDSSGRISTITDAIGQISSFSYSDNDPDKITQITDPFGRTANFSYDSKERLKSMTDMLGLTSTLTYDGIGTLSSDWVSNITTPYGTTNVNYTNTDPFGGSFFEADIELTDPMGLRQHARFAYRQNGADPSIFNSAPPGSFTPEGISTLYWDKKAMADAPLSPSSAVQYFLGTDSSEATTYFPAITIKPMESPAWFTYPGQTGERTDNITVASPNNTIRYILDSNGGQSVQTTNRNYNAFGNVTNSTDPRDRQLNHTYAPNNMDILNTTDGDGDVLSSATYNNQHEPLTTTDAAGKTTHYGYNGAGQITSMTTPMGENTSYNYDSNGYLLSVNPPQPGSTVTYTYDTVGRIRTKTDAVSGTVTYTYDSGDRITNVAYPDGTHEAYNYNKLDLQSFSDRQQRTTSYTYDNDRRMLTMTDPKMQTTVYGWCACGSMTSMTDPKGNKTQWDYDLEGRVITKTYPDMSTYSYQYNPTENLLTIVTDAKHQQTQYVYDIDDKLLNVNYIGAQVATPNVSYQYDQVLGRMVQMKDGTGTTTYDYYPFGQTGGNQIQEIDQPVGTSIAHVEYTYDADGRVASRSIDGSTESYGYTNAELTSVTNPLGSFAYNYDASSARLNSVAYPNGQNTAYTYFQPTDPNGASGSLKTITNMGGGSTSGQTLSKFCYTYKPTGEITTWQQQLDNTPADAKTYSMGYDQDSELQGVTLTSGTSGFDNLTANQSVTYGYDAAGNRTTEYTPSFVHNFGTNNLNQLTNETDKPISVTGSTSQPASVIVNGQTVAEDTNNVYKTTIQPAGGASTPLTIQATTQSGTTSTKKNHVLNTVPLVYDANGNLTNDGTKIYTWDAANRLMGVSFIAPQPITSADNLQMSYDGKGRRVSIIEQHGSIVSKANSFVWIKNNICEERDSLGKIVSKKFFNVGEVIGSATYYYSSDHLGSIRTVEDSSGNIHALYDYDPWGRQTKLLGDLDADFGFTGFYLNRDSGFDLTMFRLYKVDMGSWLSRDPVDDKKNKNYGAVTGGDSSLYRYVNDSPCNKVDVLGLKSSAPPPWKHPGLHPWLWTLQSFETETNEQMEPVPCLKAIGIITCYTTCIFKIMRDKGIFRIFGSADLVIQNTAGCLDPEGNCEKLGAQLFGADNEEPGL